MSLEGTITAMVTPFGKDGAVDYGRLAEFVDWQCESGVDGLCPVGTTGESPTLDHAEHHKVIEETIKYAKGRVKIIAGTGANSTAEAVHAARMAEHFGASTEGAHRALADCKMTYYVYEGLKDVMDKRLASGDVKCCPKCGSPLMKRNGKFGEFWGCVGYPACRYTERS